MFMKKLAGVALAALLLTTLIAALPAGAQDDTDAAEEPTPAATEEPTDTAPADTASADDADATTEPPAPRTDRSINAEAAGLYSAYIIQPGDTLFAIATRYDTTVTVLSRLNGIVNPSVIYWGQQIRIPIEEEFGEGGPEATPEATEETAPAATEEAAPEATEEAPAATEEPEATATPPADTDAYTVREGDNLYRIALRFGTTVTRLQTLNDINNPNVIYIGQQLVVPGN